MNGWARRALMAMTIACTASAAAAPPRVFETLDRGVVAGPAIGGGWLVSWRLLRTDAKTIAFDVYRDGRKITPSRPSVARLQTRSLGRRFAVHRIVRALLTTPAKIDHRRTAAFNNSSSQSANTCTRRARCWRCGYSSVIGSGSAR